VDAEAHGQPVRQFSWENPTKISDLQNEVG